MHHQVFDSPAAATRSSDPFTDKMLNFFLGTRPARVRRCPSDGQCHCHTTHTLGTFYGPRNYSRCDMEKFLRPRLLFLSQKNSVVEDFVEERPLGLWLLVCFMGDLF